MSEPSAGAPGNRVTRPVRQVAARISRWRNTRRGTATLKGMYAQAARDAKRMDPTVRERIGRANLTKADLQSLAEAHVTGAYDPRQRGYSRQLSGRAAAQAMTADQSVIRNRNPIRQVANRVSRWRNTRQGTATLKAAYSQAAKDVKRMDPAIRESIGRSRITKADLQNLSQSAMQETFRPEGRQTPYQVQPRFQQQLQSRPNAQGQAQPQQQSPAHAEPPAPSQDQGQDQGQGQGQRARAEGQAQQPAQAQGERQPQNQQPQQTAQGEQPQQTAQGEQPQQATDGEQPQRAVQSELDPALHNVQQVPVQAAPPRPQMSPEEAARAQQARDSQQARQADPVAAQQPQPGQPQPDPALHNVQQVPVQAAPPRPQMSPEEAAQAQQAREGAQASGEQGQQAQGAGQAPQSQSAQQAQEQGRQGSGRHREQGRSGGRHREQGRAQQLAASYQALRQGPGRHRAGAGHQAGQNQSPASPRAQAQQGLNLRQRLQAVKQFHQTLSNQSPAQQAATVAQLNSSGSTQQNSGTAPRTTGDAAKAFAGVAGANGAVAGKPTPQTTDRQGKPTHTSQRTTDTKER